MCNSWWDKELHGRPKYYEETHISATLSTRSLWLKPIFIDLLEEGEGAGG
jgi:hypothetical protein